MHDTNAFFIDYDDILLTCMLVLSNCPMLTVKTPEQRLIPHFGAFIVNVKQVKESFDPNLKRLWVWLVSLQREQSNWYKQWFSVTFFNYS